MSPDTSLALIEWANVISAEVQNLCEATGNNASAGYIRTAMREVNNAKEEDDQSQPCPEPGHISDAEAVAAQAVRIRDLVSENVRLRNSLKLCVARLEEYPDANDGTALEFARLTLEETR